MKSVELLEVEVAAGTTHCITSSPDPLFDMGEPVGWRRQRSRLLDEKAQLRRLLTGLRTESTSRSDFDPHDVSDDEAAIQADLVERRLIALEDALARLDSGTYGQCTRCGSPIREERLEALPATAHCSLCAS